MNHSPLHRRYETTQKVTQTALSDFNFIQNEKNLFNGLPRDLIWMIMEYTPGVLFKLRGTSRNLKSYVDEFATLHSTIPVVEKIKIKGSQDTNDVLNPVEETPSGSINISVLANKSFMKLLKLRLVPLLPFEILKESTHKDRDVNGMHPCRHLFRPLFGHEYYDFNFTAIRESNILLYMRRSFGQQIETVIIVDCTDRERLAAVAKLLIGVQINRMKIQTKTLTQPALRRRDFLSKIGNYDVEKLKLDYERNMSADPGKFQSSKSVRSLYICQNFVHGILVSKPFFFGVYEEDWEPVILEMFKRKLDKLCIRNIYSSYLGYCSANSLVNKLPLLDKKVWFSTSINRHAKIVTSETVSCNFVSDNFKGHKIMCVRHPSRVNESF